VPLILYFDTTSIDLVTSPDFSLPIFASIKSLEALELQPFKNQLIAKSLKKTLNTLEKQIKQLEDKLQANLEKAFAKEIKLLSSIPGIGKKRLGCYFYLPVTSAT